MKRSHLNLALAAVVAGLAAAAWLGREKEEKGPPLTALKADAITDIRIEHPDAKPIALKKENGTWRLTEPVQAPADDLEVSAILQLAEMETKLTLDPGAAKPAELKLDPPSYTVTLNGQKLAIGDVEPLNYRRYVGVDGKIVLVDDPPGTALDADHSDLVAKTPLPPNAEIVKVELPKLTVERAADGTSWKLTPDDPAAGADARQKFIDGWKSARALWMSAAGTTKGEPVTITLKDGQVLKFVVVAREPQLMLAREDYLVSYALSKALEEEILKIPAAPEAPPAPEGDDTRIPAAADEPLPKKE